MEQILDQVVPLLIPIVHYVAVCLVLAGLVWAGTEGLGEAFPSWPKARTKFVLGFAIGALAYGGGWLPSPEGYVPEGAQRAYGWAFAALTAWLCSWGVGRIHDRMIAPWQAKRRGP